MLQKGISALNGAPSLEALQPYQILARLRSARLANICGVLEDFIRPRMLSGYQALTSALCVINFRLWLNVIYAWTGVALPGANDAENDAVLCPAGWAPNRT